MIIWAREYDGQGAGWNIKSIDEAFRFYQEQFSGVVDKTRRATFTVETESGDILVSKHAFKRRYYKWLDEKEACEAGFIGGFTLATRGIASFAPKLQASARTGRPWEDD